MLHKVVLTIDSENRKSCRVHVTIQLKTIGQDFSKLILTFMSEIVTFDHSNEGQLNALMPFIRNLEKF